MPSSTRSNKENQLLFSPDPASLERSIRKEACSSSIDNNTRSSLDFVQPPLTQTLVPSTDTRSPPSTEDTHLPSTDIVHPTSIDTPSHTSIDTEPRDMVATLILLNWNSSLLLGRAFLSTVGAVCNLQTNQLCLTLIDPNAHYDPIPVKKPQMSSRRINDSGIIAACHCGAEYETEYSASIETHTTTSIDSGHQKSTDTPHEESVDSRSDDWENDYYNPIIAAYTRQHMHIQEYDEDYEDARATEYKAILDEEDRLLHHSSRKRNAPSIDMPGSRSIDTQPYQRNQK
ncbi:hypothetical protein F2Q69_00027042 [Brassica cretica]|uniref:Uncharacterized protein n=1 Tax=Brassica cretica TaxID=69181 RepID=A0A8S9RUP9_BRACR|nr:hypothetical protein F2Q69_00027042 [Brassica cretica]